MLSKYLLSLLLSALISLLILASCGTNASTNSTPTPGTGGEVSLHVNTSSYHVRDKIVVQLSNKGQKTILFEDHQTNCTVIQVEYKVTEVWKMLENCGVLSHTSTFSLEAGKDMQVTLSAPTRGWKEGLYRAALTYHLSQPASSFITVYSATFMIGGSI